MFIVKVCSDSLASKHRVGEVWLNGNAGGIIHVGANKVVAVLRDVAYVHSWRPALKYCFYQNHPPLICGRVGTDMRQ